MSPNLKKKIIFFLKIKLKFSLFDYNLINRKCLILALNCLNKFFKFARHPAFFAPRAWPPARLPPLFWVEKILYWVEQFYIGLKKFYIGLKKFYIELKKILYSVEQFYIGLKNSILYLEFFILGLLLS